MTREVQYGFCGWSKKVRWVSSSSLHLATRQTKPVSEAGDRSLSPPFYYWER